MPDVFRAGGCLYGRQTFVQFYGMRRRINLYIRSNQDVVPDGDGVAIHQCAARVDADVVADMDMATIITNKRASDGNLLADASKHLFQDSLPFVPAFVW